MAYDAQIELVRTRLLATLGSGLSGLDTLALWDRYLTANGFTLGTLLERMAKAAAASSRSLDNYIQYGPLGLGPEMAPLVTDAAWSLTLQGGAAGTVVSDGTGIHFVGANNVSSAFRNGILFEDNALYEITWTVANYTSGSSRILIGGNTIDHGFSSPSHSGAGTFTERGSTSSAPFGSSKLIRVQATGANGTNSFDVTSLSIKKVL